MKYVLMFIISFLLMFTLYRVASDQEPLTLSGFFEILSHFDYDFDSTRTLLTKLSTLTASFPDIGNFLDFLKYIAHFLQVIGVLVGVLVAVVIDITKMITSVFYILFALIGFPVVS